MAEIIPAIIGQDFATIRNKIEQVEDLVDWVELDIVDGLFAENHTWEHYEDLLDLAGQVKIEIHLMVEQPEHYVADWMTVADRIVVHLEATEKLPIILNQFVNSPVQVGIAALPETPIGKLLEYDHRVSVIQLLGIKNIGRQGQPFEEVTVERVRELRKHLPQMLISVDGGINLENAAQLIAAGANNLVLGSAVWQSGNVAETIKKFQQL